MSALDSEFDAIVRQAQSLDPERRQWWDQSFDGGEETELDSAERLLGSNIGRYRVVGLLGAGGMGRVLLAERADEQFSQRVAIKLVRGDLVSKQVHTRLRIERQILATLDHPNIAKLLDGGSHNGVPYIVMEYVDGQPIDSFCNERRMSVRERLVLFRTVCSAVHYAHQNLIVHRDLKPTNILVAADGVPKLLDFGIAKLLDGRRFAQTMAVTHFDSRLMTPDHASPEQVLGDSITTASDTYVLGVLLYELLTGRKPLTVRPERLADLERAICEQIPPPLAYGLGSDARLPEDFLATLCAERATTAGRLRKELTGDLDAIVAMALRKDPERRYSSVEQFSNDIGRYLDGLPITARRDTLAYRTKKFVGRHRLGVGLGTAAIATLIGFSVVTSLQAQRIALERTRAEEVSSFLIGMFEEADPEQSRGNEVTVKELIDAASRRIEGELQDQPATRSRLLATLGTVYGELGDFDDAKKSLRDALSLQHEDIDSADLERRLARVLIDNEELAEADRLLESAMNTTRERFGAVSAENAALVHMLARLRRKQERLGEAAALHARSVEILEQISPPDHAALVSALNQWAVLLDYRQDYHGAERTYRKALDLGRAHLGGDHPFVAQSLLGVAAALAGQGEFDAAAPLYEQAIALYRHVFGNDHPRTAQLLANYGIFLRRAHKLGRAEETLRESVAMHTRVNGASHVRTAYAQVSLGLVLLESKRPQEARAQFEAALASYARTLPPNHQYVGSALLGLGRAQLNLGEADAAGETLAKAAAIARQQYSTQSVAVASISAAQGAVLLAQGQLPAAEPMLLDAYRVIASARGASDSYASQVQDWITSLYERQGRKDEAARFFESLDER